MKKYLIFVLILSGCWPNYKYHIGVIPDTPINLTEINSEFDDYNSDISVLGETFPLCFSSNRKTEGRDFDVIFKMMYFLYSKEDGKLNFSENTDSNLGGYIRHSKIRHALTQTNTIYNELGPYLVPATGHNTEYGGDKFIYLYSNDENGNHDIKFSENLVDGSFVPPQEILFLNTEFDELYPSINVDHAKIYFTSNRNGKFNIYEAAIDSTMELVEILADSSNVLVEMVENLSSDFDDKCPFVKGQVMVFTSNRPGGFGGFDLYYSVYKYGSWSNPVNFGEKINTEFDEYRPIIRPQLEFTSDLMIFSSNRPGGKGGFDLYYVGIKNR